MKKLLLALCAFSFLAAAQAKADDKTASDAKATANDAKMDAKKAHKKAKRKAKKAKNDMAPKTDTTSK